jgi:hypothetical protein
MFTPIPLYPYLYPYPHREREMHLLVASKSASQCALMLAKQISAVDALKVSI